MRGHSSRIPGVRKRHIRELIEHGEWTKVFPEARLCKAIVDRLTFNAHIIETGTESWRFQEDPRALAAKRGEAQEHVIRLGP